MIVGSEDLALAVRDILRTTTLAFDVVVVADLRLGIRTLKTRDPAALAIAVVEGKDAALSAMSAGVDEVLEARMLSTEMLQLAVRLAQQRADHQVAREKVERTLSHRERLSALGTVVAGVAHEITSPAAGISMNIDFVRDVIADLRQAHAALEMILATESSASAPLRLEAQLRVLRARLHDPEIDSSLRDSKDALQVIIDLSRDLRTGASDGADPSPEVVDVRKLVTQVLRLVGVERVKGLHVETNFADDLPLLWLPRSRLRQIVTNLLSNACQAMATSPRAVHRLRVEIDADQTSLMLAVSDTGSGIGPELLSRLFQPFVSTKTAGEGTGLGLYMSRQIVRRLGGDLIIDSDVGVGTTAQVFLPVALRTVSASERPRSDEAPSRTPRVMLVFEDERELGELAQLMRQRYHLTLALDAVEALGRLAQGARPDAVVCQLGLRTLDVTTFWTTAVSQHPELRGRFVFVGSKETVPVALADGEETVALGTPREVVAAVAKQLAGPSGSPRDT